VPSPSAPIFAYAHRVQIETQMADEGSVSQQKMQEAKVTSKSVRFLFAMLAT